jgi:hypothetical protein
VLFGIVKLNLDKTYKKNETPKLCLRNDKQRDGDAKVGLCDSTKKKWAFVEGTRDDNTCNLGKFTFLPIHTIQYSHFSLLIISFQFYI